MRIAEYTKLIVDGNIAMNEICANELNCVGNSDALYAYVVRVKDQIVSKSAELQKLIIDRLVMRYLRYQPLFIREKFMLDCKALGIAINESVFKKATEVKVEHVKIAYKSLTKENRAKLLNDMQDIDFSNNDQYADRLTTSEQRNAQQRSSVYSQLSNLTIDTLRMLWLECTNDNHKEIIASVGNRRKQNDYTK